MALISKDPYRFRVTAAGAMLLCAAVAAGAQSLPSEPIVLGHGRVTLGGELSGTFGSDDPGSFNDTDYERSNLRVFRGDLTASVKPMEHVSFLADLRVENGGLYAYALFVRVRPWTARALDVQIGRVPPTFGAFARRAYGLENPLIGAPLAYQYLTTLREDSLPASADELHRMRGSGSLLSFSVGNGDLDHGVAIASASRWDTGVQVHAASDLVDATASVTAGTLSYPVWHDGNGGQRMAGRVALHPVVGLIIGASASRGPFMNQTVAGNALVAGADRTSTQTAWGSDVEYSRGYYLVRAETLWSQWTLPTAQASGINVPLRALGTSIEGRYKIRPGLYAAARLDHLGFSEIAGSFGRDTWDAPVSRVEIGGGYSLQRNLLLKFSYQYNARDGGPVRSLGLVATQLQFWF
jgi:hypothetical protein